MKKLVALAAVCSLFTQFNSLNSPISNRADKENGLVESERTSPVSGALTTSQSSNEEEELQLLENLQPSNILIRRYLDCEPTLCYVLAKHYGSIELIANLFDLTKRDDRLVWYLVAHSESLDPAKKFTPKWKEIQEEMKTYLTNFKRQSAENEIEAQKSIAETEAAKREMSRRIRGYLNEI